MKFATPDMGGSFLISSLQICDAPGKVEQQDSIVSENPLFHHAYIGEVLSVIYLPLYIQGDRLFDGVVDQPIAKISDAMSSFTSLIDNNPRWYITFMGTVCPQCGWNLDGARDSVVLTCNNCETAWEASKGKFIQVNFATVPGKKDDVFYLPFWKMNVRFKDPEINSYADFIRITNQPKAVQTQWEHQDICFWTPAFKIRPKIFLQLSKNLTINQMTFALNNNIPQKNLFPVTLPQREAAQSIKVILASLAMNKKAVFSFLPQTHCIVRETTLVFLPFNDTRHEIHQEHLPVSIHKKTLEYGRYL